MTQEIRHRGLVLSLTVGTNKITGQRVIQYTTGKFATPHVRLVQHDGRWRCRLGGTWPADIEWHNTPADAIDSALGHAIQAASRMRRNFMAIAKAAP
jgi:hypothetical protein